MFCCLKACTAGGETIIVDCRRVYEDLPRKIVEQFQGKTFPMTRRFRFDLLQQNMETDDRESIEAACKELGVGSITWSEMGVTITSDLPAVIYHDETGEPIWCNRLLGANPWAFVIQSYFSILKTRDLGLKARAISLLPPYLLYLAPYLLSGLLSGKRSQLEGEAETPGLQVSTKVAYQLARAYWKNAAVFSWREGDVLLLDNRLVAHGRMPFRGERSIVTCVTQPTLPKSAHAIEG